MTRRPRLIAALFCAALSYGCAGLLTSSEPADHVYWLEAPELQMGAAPDARRPELFVGVSALPGLDTDRLLVREPGARLNSFAGARWPDYLPEFMSAMLRVSLESSRRFHRVRSGTNGAGAAWSLQLELREFFAVAGAGGAPPEVRVHLAGHLACNDDETAVSATGTAMARENRLARIVAGFQEATDAAFVELGRQLQTHCFAAVAD